MRAGRAWTALLLAISPAERSAAGADPLDEARFLLAELRYGEAECRVRAAAAGRERLHGRDSTGRSTRSWLSASST